MAVWTETRIREYYCLLAWLFMLFGMVFSKLLLSMGVIGLMLNAVFHRELPIHWQRFRAEPSLLALAGIFLLYALSGLWSENLGWLVNRLRMKLPFVALPFAVVALPAFHRRTHRLLLYFFFLLVLATCIYLTGWYLIHWEEMNASYKLGQVLPTPTRHIHFSLMVVVAAAIGWDHWRQGFHWRYSRAEAILLLGGTLFMLAFLHLLAVRSGLLALYLVMLYLAGRELVVKKRFGLGLLLVLLAVLAAVGAVRLLPTLQNKINYTLYNIEQIRKGENLQDLSDAYRVASIEGGIQLLRQHPWLGVGIGDIRDETVAYVADKYPAVANEQFMPQSQLVLVAAATGYVGLLIFLCCLLLPLLYRKAYQEPLLVAVYIIAGSAMVAEQLLETQPGTAVFIVFVIGLLREKMDKDL